MTSAPVGAKGNDDYDGVTWLELAGSNPQMIMVVVVAVVLLLFLLLLFLLLLLLLQTKLYLWGDQGQDDHFFGQGQVTVPRWPHFWWNFCICDHSCCFVVLLLLFFYPTIEVVTFGQHWWCVLGVFVASIHPSRTWMLGSFESLRWNTCVHRLDLGLHSHPKEGFKEWSQNSF